MEKITDILFCEVQTETGKKLGRVFDIRSEGEPDHGVTNRSRDLDFMLCGESGLFQRLGFKEKELICVPFSEIKEFGDGKIIVSEVSEEE
jgi:sporulation protein YlmC with PRC-barrel domain